jgi:hypothetical protein
MFQNFLKVISSLRYTLPDYTISQRNASKDNSPLLDAHLPDPHLNSPRLAVVENNDESLGLDWINSNDADGGGGELIREKRAVSIFETSVVTRLCSG